MSIPFSKYHGAGNDFILLDGMYLEQLMTSDIAFLCNRHIGIGADGLMILLRAGFDRIQMKYFNSDGRESSLCGNGGRCAAAYIHHQGWGNKSAEIEAVDGLHKTDILSVEGNHYVVRIQMNDTGVPKNSGLGFLLNTGSPHHVQYVKDIEALDVQTEGAKIRYSGSYAPDGVNVDFVQEVGDALHVRTYERGVENETLSCGTGVTAVALVHAFRKGQFGDMKTRIVMPGGVLSVSFKFDESGFSRVFLEGPATRVFEGTINLPGNEKN